MRAQNKTKDAAIRVNRYADATVTKFDNRRVIVRSLTNDEFGICFKILTDEKDAEIPAAGHTSIKGKVKVTTLKISKKAAQALWYALHTQLTNV